MYSTHSKESHWLVCKSERKLGSAEPCRLPPTSLATGQRQAIYTTQDSTLPYSMPGTSLLQLSLNKSKYKYVYVPGCVCIATFVQLGLWGFMFYLYRQKLQKLKSLRHLSLFMHPCTHTHTHTQDRVLWQVQCGKYTYTEASIIMAQLPLCQREHRGQGHDAHTHTQ